MALRTRLTAAFVLVVLVPLLIGALFVMRAFPRANDARQAETASAAGRLLATVVTSYCARAQATAEAAGRAFTASPDRVGQRAIEDLVARRLADGVRVTSTSGASRAVAGSAPTPADAGNCVEGTAGPAGTQPYLTAVVRLTTAAGGESGSALAAYRIDTAFARQLQTAVGSGTVALLADGHVVATSGPLPEGLVTRLLASAEVERAYGRVGLVSSARPGQPYAVLVAFPRTADLNVLAVVIGVLLGAVLLAALIAWLLARATTRPLEELGIAAARIASGDLDTTIDVGSRDEVGRLAGTFNDMTDELRTYVRALEASRDELQAGLSRLGDTLSSTHDMDRILSVVLETAMASTRAQAGMVLLFGPGRDALSLAVCRNVRERGVPDDLRMPVGLGISGRVAETGDAAMGRIGEGFGLVRAGAGEPVEGSVIAVPLKSSGTVIGVLDLFDRLDAEAFDERDLATIRTFANQATVAIDNVLLHEEAQRLSITDGLTGLWNYRYFTMTVGKEIERSARFGRPLALLMLDLDHFKDVNDTFGHQRGDAVLVELAARVRAQVRDVDTVARYGGEEVVVVLPETDENGAVQAAERICDAVRRRPFGEPGEPPVEVTVSIGVAVFPTHGGTSGILLRRADEALYEAKGAGRDTWRVATVPPVPVDQPAH